MNAAPHRRRSSIVRAVVLASATLAIVLVCYSIYQYSQLDPEEAARAAEPFALVGEAPPSLPAAGEEGAVALGAEGIQIGSGERASVTLYPPEGTRAIGEIEADDWSPIAGPGNRIRLVNPFIRAETNDGRRLNIRGDEAVIETSQSAQGRGGRFEPRRGTLTGSVVIEIDRLTRYQREQLPQEQRDVVDRRRLIRVEMEAIEFDLEYSRVSVAGPFHVSAYELDFEAADLSVLFDPGASRIESLSTRGGGRLELRGMEESFGFSLTGSASGEEDPLSWREALAAKLAPPLRPTTDAPKPSKPYIDEEGALVLVPDAQPGAKPHEPIQYEARFEDEVLVAQESNGVSTGRLRADVLTMVRALTQADRDATGSSPKPAVAAARPGGEASNEGRLVLSWAGPLSVQAIEDGPGMDDLGGNRLQIVATGNPVLVSDEQGDARCSELVFSSVGKRIWLHGTRETPVTMRSAAHGTIVAVSIVSQSVGDRRTIKAAGPGRLIRGTEAGVHSGVNDTGDASAASADGDSWVDFRERFEAETRTVRRRGRFDLGSLSWTSEEVLVLESARFFGGVVMHQEATDVEADQIELTFDPEVGSAALTRLVGRSDVVMSHGQENKSKIACDRIEVEFDPRSGDTIPRVARAFGHISASHEDATITARDRMNFVFRELPRASEEDDLLDLFNQALEAGIDLNRIDWEAKRRQLVNRARPVIELAHLTAYGEVTVVDPQRELQLSAGQLECELGSNNEIHSAVLNGAGVRPASVRLGTFSVMGNVIKLNVDDEWAEVPGPGRMSFQVDKDLDGRLVDKPITVVVNWSDWMKYRGRENRAVFVGNIHTVSDRNRIDCGRLEIEFEDSPGRTGVEAKPQQWWILDDVVNRLPRRKKRANTTPGGSDFAKEPTYFLATEGVRSEMSNVDETTGRLVSRISISGPRMSVNLREEVSMMRIEGKGQLLIEDYSLADADGAGTDRHDDNVAGALFGGRAKGASQTLITWERLMFYDLANERAQFECAVELDHLSGTYMVHAGGVIGQTAPAMGADGQKAHLGCNVLSVDFLSGKDAAAQASPRMGTMSSRRLEQFRANGSVELTRTRPGDSQWLSADELTYRKTRQLLLIQGSDDRPAEFITQKTGQPPRPYRATTITVNLATNRVDALNPTYMGP